MVKSILVFTLLIFLSGCSVLKTVAENENQLAVNYATAKVIERPDVSAEYVLELVARAKSYVEDSSSVAVSVLASAARDELAKSDMSFADRLVVEAILVKAQQRIEDRIGSGLLIEEERLSLLTVLGWIEDTARAYARY